MIRDMPTITDAGHSHTVYGLANMGEPVGVFAATTSPAPFSMARDWPPSTFAQAALPLNKPMEKPIMPAPARRLVQVFIADPDENVPLDKSLLYSGEQKLTDATDQELFFEIELKAILEKHNAERVQFVNKRVKERTEFLEPVKIRDLKMVVVNVATF
jgi:hypothetical protein